MTLSAVIITKNEARHLKDCIFSLQDLADEIVVIDSQSTDDTREVAKANGARVIIVNESLGFGEKRQFAQQHVTCEWVIHLDADERIPDNLKDELKNKLLTAKDHEIFAIPRANHLFGERLNHCGWSPDYVLRCYKTSYTSFNNAKVHEHVVVPDDGKIVFLKNPLIHFTYQSVEQCLFKQKNYAIAFAEQKNAANKTVSLWSIPFRGIFSFLRVFIIRKGFLDGRWGLWNAISTASYTTNKYLALYAANKGKKLRL